MEFLVTGDRDQLALARVTELTIGDTAIPAVPSARNLGPNLESACSVKPHVKALCQSARCYLRNFGCIRRYLDPETSRLVVHVLVTSLEDNLNALSCSGPHSLYNSCATSSEFSGQVGGRIAPLPLCIGHGTGCLLHNYRCQFKILMQIFKGLLGQAAAYVVNMLTPYGPQRSWRSTDQ